MPYLKANADKAPDCAYTLGKAYTLGLATEKDNAVALKMYMRAANKRYPPAMTKVGDCYAKGLGYSMDDKQALAWYRKAAESGDTGGMIQAGDFYAAGRGVPKDLAKANQFYEKAAKAGSIDGMMRCADLALIATKKATNKKAMKSASDPNEARVHWLTKAADAGDLDAAFALHVWKETGYLGEHPPMSVMAFPTYTKAVSDTGSSGSLLMLASCHLKGWGCRQDPSKADELFREALAAAKRDAIPSAEKTAQKLVSAGTTRERMAILDHELGWSKKPVSTLDLPQDQDAPTEKAEIGKLVLTDIVAKPSDSESYLEVQGRVKNASDDSLESLKIAVTLEDRAGNLLETDDAYLKPDPLEPGEVGTFKLLVKSAERYDHLKVDFTVGSGKSIPWVDKSGKDVHQ